MTTIARPHLIQPARPLRSSSLRATRPALEVYPSLMAADLLHLARDIKAVHGASGIHFDVMDGHFVPNITFGPGMLQAVRGITRIPVSVHLMVERPQDIIPSLTPHLGTKDIVYLHAELPASDLKSAFSLLGRAGVPAGLTLRPSTPLTRLAHAIRAHPRQAKALLILGAEPGFHGQRMRPRTARRVTQAAALAGHLPIFVDEGVTLENAHALKQAGARGIISGHCVFSTKGKSPMRVISELRKQ